MLKLIVSYLKRPLLNILIRIILAFFFVVVQHRTQPFQLMWRLVVKKLFCGYSKRRRYISNYLYSSVDNLLEWLINRQVSWNWMTIPSMLEEEQEKGTGQNIVHCRQNHKRLISTSHETYGRLHKEMQAIQTSERLKENDTLLRRDKLQLIFDHCRRKPTLLLVWFWMLRYSISFIIASARIMASVSRMTTNTPKFIMA